MAKGIGCVEVYRSLKRVDEPFTYWQYHLSSDNRFFSNGSEFTKRCFNNLEELAQTIMDIHDSKEKITIINRCLGYDNRIGEDNPSLHIDNKGATEHYERLKISELEELGRAISKNRRK